MIDKRTIFDIHRLAHAGLSVRKIAKTLGLARHTVHKYLDDPSLTRASFTRSSQLDPFKDEIARLVEIDPKASAGVIRQRLAAQGFEGGLTIVRDYVQGVRDATKKRQPVIRFESAPGVQCQTDWGHFGTMAYGDTHRKLYCLAVIACHSRLLYLEFTHSQRQDTLHRCLLNAFHFFQGTPTELVHDNMLTAVLERQGPLVRFNEHFLEFLRPFHITPIACNVAQPQEKGKVEKGAMHYIRHNFWPLRTFRDLPDLQAQANQWRDQVANVRVHTTTGHRPSERFDPKAMRPLPELLPDCRETAQAKVHTALGQALKSLYLLRYIQDEPLRAQMQLQLNRGERRHQLARRLFFANQGAFQTGDYEEMMNKATCLSLLSNAVVVWNTVQMSRTIAQLRANGATIADEDFARVSPLAFAHVIPNGTYFVRQGQEGQRGSLRAPHDRQHDDA